MATLTPFANNVVIALSYESGGPGSLSRVHFKLRCDSALNRKCPHSSLVPRMRERPGRGEDNTHTGVANLLCKKVSFSCAGKCKTKASS
jgi:hypothetical protein